MDDINNIAENAAVLQIDRREKRETKEVVHNDIFYQRMKVFFDFFAALIASVILAVPIGIIALVIVLKDGGNPFYLHKRIGLDGKVIKTAKFRSMRTGADDLENMLTPEQLAEYHKNYKIEDDPRLIGYKKPGDGKKCFGAVLRQCSLDELPQIPYNILYKRDMSFVGPRPILKEELEKYYTPAEQKKLLSVKPGVTGYWQAYARNNAGYEDGRRQKMELYYIDNKSMAMDIKILFKTVATVLEKKGVS